ncbi:MAG: hypothetical protein ACLSHC_15170 [Bilophila wadsworthia]
MSDPDALMRLVAALTGEAQAGLPLASANLEAALSGTLDAPGLVLKASVPGIVLDAAQPDARLDVASSWTLAVRSLLSEPSVTADATVNLGGPFVRKAMSANQAAKNGKEGERSGEVPIRLHVEASETAETLRVKALRVESEWLALAGDARWNGDGQTCGGAPAGYAFAAQAGAVPARGGVADGFAVPRTGGHGRLESRRARDDASSPFAGTLSFSSRICAGGLPASGYGGRDGFARSIVQRAANPAPLVTIDAQSRSDQRQGNASTDGKKLDAALSSRCLR